VSPRDKTAVMSNPRGPSSPVRFADHSDNTLRCPMCGDFWLHQRDVIIGVRDLDDFAPGTVVTVKPSRAGASVTTSRDGLDDFISCRHEIIISFECETCGHLPMRLHLMQSKGTTSLEWWPIPDGGPSLDLVFCSMVEQLTTRVAKLERDKKA
jgi:hypothetical protein